MVHQKKKENSRKPKGTGNLEVEALKINLNVTLTDNKTKHSDRSPTKNLHASQYSVKSPGRGSLNEELSPDRVNGDKRGEKNDSATKIMTNEKNLILQKHQ